MEEYTLVVLAAGMGSRFGGLKQMEPVGPYGEFIIDYSIYDAIKAGFNKVVFVIKEENEEAFKETIGRRIEGKVKVEYAYQKMEDLPEGYNPPAGRTKPWGTAHAVYSARNLIKGPFAVINADDFYGANAYEILMDFLKNNTDRTHYLAVGYKIVNTLSKNGSVKRGVITAQNGVLEKITESKITVVDNTMVAEPLDGSKKFTLTEEDLATVNLFGFTTGHLRELEEQFTDFLDAHGNEMEAEYLLTDVLTKQIKDKTATIYIKGTPDKWHGVTYREDKEDFVNTLNTYINEEKYPKNLWE